MKVFEGKNSGGKGKNSGRFYKSVIELSGPTVNFNPMENLKETSGMSPLVESAIRLNEIYKSLIEGGFTEDEALSLIAKMTKNGR